MKNATNTTPRSAHKAANLTNPQDWDACFEAYKADMSSIIRTGLTQDDVNDILSSLRK